MGKRPFLTATFAAILCLAVGGCADIQFSRQRFTNQLPGGGSGPVVLLPKNAFEASDLGLIVNDSDPLSVQVATYYQSARGIPDKNVIHLSFPPGGAALSAGQFAPLKAIVDAAADAAGPLQGLVVTWTYPYRVNGMSITSAFALGYADKYWNAAGAVCNTTAASAYYQSESFRPYDDFRIRPTMMLAANRFNDAKALIDRGVASDSSFPEGNAFLMNTTDQARNVRYASDFAPFNTTWSNANPTSITVRAGVGGNAISNQSDVLFYLTGLASVPSITTNRYLPGAVADHLTSFGGVLDTMGQMSSVRWLEAGLTASFGTVEEPCNYTAKFPKASQLIKDYYRGHTILESYWKSVNWPGQGIFVGEPLANPFKKADVRYEDGTLTIELTWLKPLKNYQIESAPTPEGPFSLVMSGITIQREQSKVITVRDATAAVYRLVPTP